MKKLFYLLLCLPLAFASCDTLFPEEDQPVKSYVFTLTSEATLNFGAEGGNGVITFALNESTRSAAAPQVEATCDATWVSDLKVADTVTFVVAANDGDARETKVVVTYGDQSLEVTVKQEAKGVEPQPEYVLDVELAAAFRYPSAEYEIAENAFALVFADDAENYILQILITGAEGEVILQAGEYEVEESSLEIVENEEEYEFESGNAVVEVAEDIYSFDITLTNENGVYHFTYEGTVMGMDQSNEPDPNPNPNPNPEGFNPVKVEAYRANSWDLGNFELDLYIDETNYHSLDMMDYINPNDKYLSAGQYTMDNGGVTSWSNFLWNIETGEGAYVVDADITLAHNEDGTTTITGFFESEYGDHLDINWTGVVDGFEFGGENPEPGEDLVIELQYLTGEYYSPEAMGIDTHNYYFVLSNVQGNQYTPNATFFSFDLYADVVNDNLTIPNGVYTFDLEDSCDPWTCASYYTYGYSNDENGEPTNWYIFYEATITVTDNKIEAVLSLEDGRTATVIYEGNLSLSSYGDNEGGNGLSSLGGDLSLNGTGYAYTADNYGDYYTDDTDNWYIQIFEDPYEGNGDYLLIDLLVNPAQDYYFGSYAALTDYSNYLNTFMPGALDADGYLVGCWYTVLEEGALTGTYAPLVEGSIDISREADGIVTFTYDCVDDAGNKVVGTINAYDLYAEEEAMALNAQPKSKQSVKIEIKSGKVAMHRR